MDFNLTYVLVLLLTGLVVGFTSGLLGVGGGFIMVPIQLWVLTSMGVDPDIAVRTSFGTSLAVILPTATSGCYGHNCTGTVFWRTGIALGISGVAGAFVGGFIAAHAPAGPLKVIFGLVVLAGAIRLLLADKIRSRSKGSEGKPKRGDLYYLILGFPIGLISGVSGIGGGVIIIPIMVVAMGFNMYQAVGTSSVAIAFNSIGGVISYALNGMGVAGLPPYSVGYIDLLQLALLAGASVPMAQLGVRVCHRVPDATLRKAFVLLMFYVGLKMIGIFALLGLPI
jgi:uncharacterized membrane protein YfcA